VSNVLQFKQKPVKGLQKRTAPTEPRYVCLKCENATFFLSESGAVHCAECFNRISNLRVKDSA
jgi:DNA-directed RNA polymerase subunit RPC12/RpoP